MAISAREFLRCMKTGGFRDEDETEAQKRRQENRDDEHWLKELSDSIERHPIPSARIRRG